MSLRRVALAFSMSAGRSTILGTVALSAVLTTPHIHAQTSKGIIVGVVRDASGAVVPKAAVKLVGRSDGYVRQTTTKADGTYRAEALDPQVYDVFITAEGFANLQGQNIIVTPSQVTTFDATLSVGSGAEVVDVRSDTASINTENGQITGIINSRELSNLPLFSLSPYEVAATAPGAQYVRNSRFTNGESLQVNGARPRANNWLVDSQEINDVGIGGQAFQPAIPDSYDTLAVLTSVASAEFGRAGGAVVNLTTKAGTNTFHGTVFERYEGSGLNSVGGQERGTGYVKPRYNQHTYGFTAGGPIWRNKLFAFGGLSLKRYYGKELPSVLQLPDVAGYATLQRIGGPQVALLNQYLSNGSYLTNYVTLQGRLAQNINVGPQNSCPATGCIVTTNQFQRPSVNADSPQTQWTYRIDYKPWEKDSFYARYIHDRGSLNPDFSNNGGALVGFDTQQGGPSELGAGGWTHIFTPNLLNEFRVSETRVNFTFGPTAATQANPLYALQTINISGLPALGPNQNFPQGRGEDLYQLQDTVGWTKGRQSFRIGFDIGRQLEKDLVAQTAKGSLTFARGGTYISSLGNFLQNQLGPSGTATRTFGPTRIDPHGWRSGGFIQDDIKINPDLTLNLGARYDYLTNPENSLAYPGIDVSNPYALLNAPTTAGGSATANVYKVKTDSNNISPRFGFAYTPRNGFLADGKSVIRGGFGIYYDGFFSNFVTNAAQSSPNAPTGLLTSTSATGLQNATSLVAQIPPRLTLTSSILSVDKNMVNPVTYQYNLGIERQVLTSTFLAIRYVGSRSNKLFTNQQFNYFNGQGSRLNPNYGAINARVSNGAANYNSLQVEANYSLARHLQIRGNYTFSKAMDNGSEIFTTDSQTTSYAADLSVSGRRQEWANSAFDHRHNLNLVYVWTPVGIKVDNKFADAALGVLTRHWSISGISTFQTGTYSTFSTNGYDLNSDGSTANDRPILGNPSAALNTAAIDGYFVGGTPGAYYDMAAVNQTGALNPINTNSVHWVIPRGTSNQFLGRAIGRNSYSNPGSLLTNLAVEKGIGLSYLHLERGTFSLRAEVQNIANHNNIGILDTNVTEIGTNNFFNRKNATEDSNRSLILWGKFRF